jgi:hypothetical protein
MEADIELATFTSLLALDEFEVVDSTWDRQLKLRRLTLVPKTVVALCPHCHWPAWAFECPMTCGETFSSNGGTRKMPPQLLHLPLLPAAASGTWSDFRHFGQPTMIDMRNRPSLWTTLRISQGCPSQSSLLCAIARILPPA